MASGGPSRSDFDPNCPVEDNETGEAQAVVPLDDETGEMEQKNPAEQTTLTLTTNAETGEPEVTWHLGNGEKKKPFQVPRFFLEHNVSLPDNVLDSTCENPQDIVKATFECNSFTQMAVHTKTYSRARCFVHPALFFAVLILVSPKIGIPILLVYEIWFHSKLHSKGGDLIQHRNNMFEENKAFPYPPLQYVVRMWCTHCSSDGSEKVLKIVRRLHNRKRAKMAGRNVCSVRSQVVT